jgi:hypothetical protein
MKETVRKKVTIEYNGNTHIDDFNDRTLLMSEEMYTQGEYLKKHPTWHVEDSPWKAEQIIKIMERNRLKPNSICEVGCGAGEILNQLYFKMSDHCCPKYFKLS